MLQAAVPKYLKHEMQAATASVLPAGSSGSVTQLINVTNSMHGQKALLFKLKIVYLLNGTPVEEMAQVGNFPRPVLASGDGRACVGSKLLPVYNLF